MRLVRIAAVGLVASVLISCASVNVVTLYRASAPSAAVSAPSGDGVAFLVDGTCIDVADRGAEIRAGIAADYDAPKGFFRFAIWVVPERAVTGYTFDPTAVTLSYLGGTTVRASHAQVSRFHTRWQREKNLFFPSTEFESILNVSHGARQPASDIGDSTLLWDWTRFVLEFPKPNDSASPAEVEIGGLRYRDDPQTPVTVRLEKISEARAVYPGTSADGVSVWDRPYRVCRRLQPAAKK